MKYIGSGCLRELLGGHQQQGEEVRQIIWGRRLFNVHRADIDAIRNVDVIYLDTVDLGSCAPSMMLRARWLCSPYRLEKTMTYFLLRVFAKSVTRIHVPVITDSKVWRRLRVDDAANSISVFGFRYAALCQLLAYIAKQDEPGAKFSSRSLFSIAAAAGVEIDQIDVNKNCFNAKLLSAA